MIGFIFIATILGNQFLTIHSQTINVGAEVTAIEVFTSIYVQLANFLDAKAPLFAGALQGDAIAQPLTKLLQIGANVYEIANSCELQFSGNLNLDSALLNAIELQGLTINDQNVLLGVIGLGPSPTIIAGLQMQSNYFTAAITAAIPGGEVYSPCTSATQNSITYGYRQFFEAMANTISALGVTSVNTNGKSAVKV